MTFLYLVPIALLLGAAGLVAFLWSLRDGQYEDLDGASQRILFEENDCPTKEKRNFALKLHRRAKDQHVWSRNSEKIAIFSACHSGHPTAVLEAGGELGAHRHRAMGLRRTSSRYGVGAKVFHWLTVILVLAAYVLSKGDGYSLYSATADGIRRIHETLGMLVFIVVVLRLLWRLIDRTPATEPMPGWMAVAANLVHFALYALLIAIPATAVLGTWLEGLPVTFPGFDIAPPIAQAHGLGQLIIVVHTTLGDVILWVAGVHAAAALFHHFYLGDGVFQSMAPRRMND